MKTWTHRALALLLALIGTAAQASELSPELMRQRIIAVTEAQNRMMLSGSKVEDVDALFAHYTDDFVYMHEVYGGSYARDHLYKNSVRNLQAGRFKLTEARYRILNVITGLNAAAVERQEQSSGKLHLAVFEFKGDKVSRITEYWK